MNLRTRVGLVIGGGLVALGILALGIQFVIGDLVRVVIPLGVSGIGLVLFAIMLASPRPRSTTVTLDTGWLAVPAAMLVMLGLVFLFQATTDYWWSWTYLWTLIAPFSVGIGLIVLAWWSGRNGMRYAGIALALVGLVLLLAVGSCFELFALAIGQTTPGRFILPIAFVGLGALFLSWRRVVSFIREGSWLRGWGNRSDTVVEVKTVPSRPRELPKESGRNK